MIIVLSWFSSLSLLCGAAMLCYVMLLYGMLFCVLLCRVMLIAFATLVMHVHIVRVVMVVMLCCCVMFWFACCHVMLC